MPNWRLVQEITPSVQMASAEFEIQHPYVESANPPVVPFENATCLSQAAGGLLYSMNSKVAPRSDPVWELAKPLVKACKRLSRRMFPVCSHHRNRQAGIGIYETPRSIPYPGIRIGLLQPHDPLRSDLGLAQYQTLQIAMSVERSQRAIGDQSPFQVQNLATLQTF